MRQTNKKNIARLRSLREQKINAKTLIEEVLKGNKTALSRAITVMESKNSSDVGIAKQILNTCLPYSGKSIRVGITGVPGVGKSTFIESLGNLLIQKGHKVAVLAVDPSSGIHQGSILGDKTRMEKLVKNKNAYIRPSPSGDTLGGVTKKTRESIAICEAAGFDIVLVETVGVGQSEILVHSMVDFFLLLKLSGAGDELQGIKRGIIEMADMIAINKVDGDNITRAQKAKITFERALHLYPAKKNGWKPKVVCCSAILHTGMEQIWHIIKQYITLSKTNHTFTKKREVQNEEWLMQNITEQLKYAFFSHPKIKEKLQQYLHLIRIHQMSPYEAAQDILDFYKKVKN